MLIAKPRNRNFQIIDSYSRIDKLGEGVETTGKLTNCAKKRVMESLRICKSKLDRLRVQTVRAVATQACRVAKNSEAFLQEIKHDLGLQFEVLSPEEEAYFSVVGCSHLVDPRYEFALIIDIGGGSTELSLINIRKVKDWKANSYRVNSPIIYWISIPIGVISLAEKVTQIYNGNEKDRNVVFEEMKTIVKTYLYQYRQDFLDYFQQENCFYIGTSGTITGLAGVHLKLPSYQRSKVDGLWLNMRSILSVINNLKAMTITELSELPCIGKKAASITLSGCAILQAIYDVFPASNLWVADRGLREGILLYMLANVKKQKKKDKFQ